MLQHEGTHFIFRQMWDLSHSILAKFIPKSLTSQPLILSFRFFSPVIPNYPFSPHLLNTLPSLIVPVTAPPPQPPPTAPESPFSCSVKGQIHWGDLMAFLWRAVWTALSEKKKKKSHPGCKARRGSGRCVKTECGSVYIPGLVCMYALPYVTLSTYWMPVKSKHNAIKKNGNEFLNLNIR